MLANRMSRLKRRRRAIAGLKGVHLYFWSDFRGVETDAIDWEHPTDSARSFIAARKAYYAAWQPLPGAMGPTLASSAKQRNAQAFVKDHGGQIFLFDEVTPQLISLLKSTCPEQGMPGFKFATQCAAPKTRAGLE